MCYFQIINDVNQPWLEPKRKNRILRIRYNNEFYQLCNETTRSNFIWSDMTRMGDDKHWPQGRRERDELKNQESDRKTEKAAWTIQKRDQFIYIAMCRIWNLELVDCTVYWSTEIFFTLPNWVDCGIFQLLININEIYFIIYSGIFIWNLLI